MKSSLRPTIGIDVDGVVADLHTPWVKWLNTWGYLSVDEFTHWTHPVDLAGDFALDFLHPRIYNDDIVKPFAGAAAAVQMFRDLGYGVTFVSDCVNNTREAKNLWLERWGFLPEGSKDFLAMSDKSNAPVYMLVDDRVENVTSFKGIGVLHTRSHNRWSSAWNGVRIDHLAELYPHIR